MQRVSSVESLQTYKSCMYKGLKSRSVVSVQVVAMLVSEIVLCIKEVNKRTRIAAYELLVGLAKAMHSAEPPPNVMSLDAQMGTLLFLYTDNWLQALPISKLVFQDGRFAVQWANDIAKVSELLVLRLSRRQV